jgi:pyridoxal phosphate phosphatase PHOSPHO2
MMGELHSEGKTAEDIRGSLRRAPLSPHVVAAIKTAYALGYVRAARLRLRCPLAPSLPCEFSLDPPQILLFFRCELRILSDANAFFVDTILAHHGLADYFSGTDTNPAHVDAAGRLRIRPYHEFGAAAHGHGCALPTCPPNMCKVGVCCFLVITGCRTWLVPDADRVT